jgi:pilus assembly protein CpaB
MGRRTVLLIVAALIAALGTSLVFLYVRGVDARAAQQYDAVQVLKAVEAINPGETLAEAQAAGKIQMGTVGRGALLTGAATSIGDMGQKVALTTVYPGEQIVTAKFGSPSEQNALSIPDGKMAISVQLTDPARVAGFVSPGAEVAVFVNAEPEAIDPQTGQSKKLPDFTRLLLPRVQVIGVGDTSVVPTTTTNEEGTETTEQIPRTLLTLAVDQKEAERVLFGAKNGELAFGLLTEKSDVKSSPGVTAEDIFK